MIDERYFHETMDKLSTSMTTMLVEQAVLIEAVKKINDTSSSQLGKMEKFDEKLTEHNLRLTKVESVIKVVLFVVAATTTTTVGLFVRFMFDLLAGGAK